MPRALLMIADIGGYTRFMTVHRINLAHAQYVVGRLLESVIDAAPRGFTLAKLEGDAAFFYAQVPDGGDDAPGALPEAVTRIRGAFLARREQLTIDRLCSCDGCVQVSERKLKFVGHVGDIALQRVKQYREVAGVDVIHVHRLLKNSVPLPEYVLMSDALYAHVGEPLRTGATPLSEHLEGLGDERCWYKDLAGLTVAPSARAPSPWRKLVQWARMTVRALPYLLGLRKSCDGFKNLPR